MRSDRLLSLLLILQARGSAVAPEVAAHVHEPPLSMSSVLAILAAGSLVAGLIGLPEGLREWYELPAPFYYFVEPILGHAPFADHNNEQEMIAMAVAVALALGGIGLAWIVYGRRQVAAKGAPERAARRALVAHGGGDLVRPGQVPERARFAHGAGEGLFAENVLAGSDGGGRRRRVGVIGNGDDGGVEPGAQGVEHRPEVLESLDVFLRQAPEGGRRIALALVRGDRELPGQFLPALEALGDLAVIDVADGGDILHSRNRVDKPGSPSADPDEGDPQAGVGLGAQGQTAVLEKKRGRAAPSGAGEKPAPGERASHGGFLPVSELSQLMICRPRGKDNGVRGGALRERCFRARHGGASGPPRA